MTLDAQILDWMVGTGTGASTKCLAMALTGRPHDKSHPHDSVDFQRCMNLLDAIPDLRARLSDMAAVSPYWAALVENWDVIEAKARGGDTKGANALMRSLLDPIEDADPQVLRMGWGSIRFGP